MPVKVGGARPPFVVTRVFERAVAAVHNLGHMLLPTAAIHSSPYQPDRSRRRPRPSGAECHALRRRRRLPKTEASAAARDIIFDIDWSVELEPEVEAWLNGLGPAAFAVVSVRLDRLAARGSTLRMPHSRALGEGLFELRFELDRAAWRITYWFAPDDRVVLLTVFRKQRIRANRGRTGPSNDGQVRRGGTHGRGG